MGWPKMRHITDDQKPHSHPDRWKWESAIGWIGMEYNEYELKRNGYQGTPDEYYRQFRFAMNAKTKEDILVNDDDGFSVSFVSDGEGLTIGISGIEIRVDDDLPDGRVILIRGAICVSFDWRGREHWAEGELIGYTFEKQGEMK
jgi:hypothetical protein